MKKFLNECIDCKTFSKEAFWKVEKIQGPLKITKYYKVQEEFGPNPEHFDLNTIDARLVSNDFKVELDEAETLIMNGEPTCPNCKSDKYFSV